MQPFQGDLVSVVYNAHELLVRGTVSIVFFRESQLVFRGYNKIPRPL